MCKFPYLALLTRIISHKLAYSHHRHVDTKFNGRDLFNQTSDWSDWEKWSTWKVDQFFQNFSRSIDFCTQITRNIGLMDRAQYLIPLSG